MPTAIESDPETVLREQAPTPHEIVMEVPVEDRSRQVVETGRDEVRRILHHQEDRLLVVAGPCSVHDTQAALDYAERLARLRGELSDRLCIVMRTYFEKPRTTVGWRGLVNDPHLDGSFDMSEGLRRARRLLAGVTALGLPTAAELLDTATPDYYGDLVSFTAIGARTTESQPHRALASGLDMPVGFKNGTDGGVQIALDAMLSARGSHSYLGFDTDGRCCVVKTSGNPDTALILRGGRKNVPNFDRVSVASALARMHKNKLPAAIIVDASHANSGYDPTRQGAACESVVRQRREGEKSLVGVMLESFLVTGKQSISASMTYGLSVTDGCLGWDETEALLRRLHSLEG
jgi:3-deoxy-7-phosphoheptulonate synthase